MIGFRPTRRRVSSRSRLPALARAGSRPMASSRFGRRWSARSGTASRSRCAGRWGRSPRASSSSSWARSSSTRATGGSSPSRASARRCRSLRRVSRSGCAAASLGSARRSLARSSSTSARSACSSSSTATPSGCARCARRPAVRSRVTPSSGLWWLGARWRRSARSRRSCSPTGSAPVLRRGSCARTASTLSRCSATTRTG